MKPPQILLLLILFMASVSVGHVQNTADLKALLEKSSPDTNRVKLLLKAGEAYYFSKPDSCVILAEQAIELAQKLKYTDGELAGLNMAGEAFRFLGEFPQALEMQFKALQINISNSDKSGEAVTTTFIGLIYVELNEYRQGLNYLFRANKLFDTLSDPVRSTFNLSNIGNAYEKMDRLDSALFFQQNARTRSIALKHGNLKILILTRLGIVLARLGKHEQALEIYREALRNAAAIGDKVNPSKIQYCIAESYRDIHQEDSSLRYARLSFASGRDVSQKLQILEACNLLVKLFRENRLPDSVIHYQDIAIMMNDSLFGPGKLRQLQLLTLKEQQQQQELKQEQERYKNKTKMLALGVLLGFFLVIVILLYRNNRHKHRVNMILRDQKNEIQETLTVLRSTQSQLVQREKMASLGELTAGIAHEIQNPLNFVNNFSEVNKELIAEMKGEIDKGNYDEVKALAKDVEDNEEKINHHGKRADAIVKGMLQHSRSSSGVKELTDIKALADEYLRLAYHGLRAKDNTFNATMKTDFDESIGSLPLIPQDIGRVLLNLYTNAFYAVAEKKKQQPDGYEPTVSVRTKKIGNKVEISVKDNGNGIPQKILDKIFQPFFTTKPTGQGTGLGLSLSYDIIKAHGGEIKVETKEGEGATFIIQLPIIANY